MPVCPPGRGLKLSDDLDGAPESLQLVVECATDPEVTERLDSVTEFQEQLTAAEQELAAAREPRDHAVHPLDAGADDLLEDGFRVVRRLGKGATAVALQVEHEDGDGVLKVALDPSFNERVQREGVLLRSLRHPNIVEAYREVELSGHAAVFMAMAGAENKSGAYTLADRIREEGRLTLDLLQRFGDQLVSVVQWLEEHGVSHRDLKPDNIGVTGTPLTLMVFDFSPRGHAGPKHPRGHAAVPGSVPVAARAAAMGRVRRAVRCRRDASRDGDRATSRLG